MVISEDKEYVIHGPELHKSIPQRNFGKELYDSLHKNIDLPIALIDTVTRKHISPRTLLDESLRLSHSLRKIGITESDVIAIASENHLKYMHPILAGLYLGVTMTTFNPHYTPREIMHVSAISKPTVIFCSNTSLRSILESLKQIRTVKKILVLDDQSNETSIETMDGFIARHSDDYCTFEPIDVDSEKVAFILYSSGTTGLPKGVMLTHNNYNATNTLLSDSRFFRQVEPGTLTALGLVPFFHAYGLGVLTSSMLLGRSVLVIPKFEQNMFLEAIQNFKITSLSIVPPIANFLAHSPLIDQYDLSHVDAISCGAAPLSKATETLLLRRFKKVATIRQGYGLTEATMTVLTFPVGVGRHGACGKVLPATSAKVVDTDSGQTLGPDEKGELYFKGPQIMKGYAGDIENTNITIDKNGWLRTGDVGYYDEEGFFYVVDRLKELIKYKGFQVAPAELEAVLLRHPKIMDAAVVGIANEAAGEVPLAFVVTYPDQNLIEEDVKRFVAKQVAPHKTLRGGVRFVNEIPKNPTGKILRKNLRELLKHTSKL